jgi:hypothetical protein
MNAATHFSTTDEDEISESRSMQIKGSAENILIEENSFHGSDSIFSGNSVGCVEYYCGSPVLQTLPVPDRYVAKNVTIKYDPDNIQVRND